LLASYIVGVEVACRLGDAIDPSHYLDGLHPTGTLGTFGAAAACAHLLQLTPTSIRHALGIAGTMTAGLRANRGTMAKGLNAGRAAESGVMAATLAAEGFSASENIFDDPMGFFAAACKNKVDRKLLRFGKPFFFANPGVSLKIYPCAGVLHPALDVVLDLRQRFTIATERIDRITVTLDVNAALPLVYDRPKDELQAKFSLHFAVAAALVDGAAGLKQFSAERISSPKIRNLMKRVEFIRRPPRKGADNIGIHTAVEIAMKAGAVHRGRADIARGHPALPPSRAEIAEKFRQCGNGVLTPKQIERFLQKFDTLERAASVTTRLQGLCPARR
jgi:2-methylcitrate dehydratase PrpD